MRKLKLQGEDGNQVLFLNKKLELTLPDLDNTYLDYVYNYKKHVTWTTSSMMIDGTPNLNYKESINMFKQFLDEREIKFNIVEKYHNGLKCNMVRINIDKNQIEIMEIE